MTTPLASVTICRVPTRETRREPIGDRWCYHCRDRHIKWGGVKTGGIRISAMTGLDRPLEMALQESRRRFKAVRIDPLHAPKSHEPDAIDDRIAAATTVEELRELWAFADERQQGNIQAKVDTLTAQEPEEGTTL